MIKLEATRRLKSSSKDSSPAKLTPQQIAKLQAQAKKLNDKIRAALLAL